MARLTANAAVMATKPTLRLVHGRPSLKGPVEVKVKAKVKPQTSTMKMENFYQDRNLDILSDADREFLEKARKKASDGARNQEVTFKRKFFRLGSPEAQRINSWDRTMRELRCLGHNMEEFKLLPGDKVKLNRLLKKVSAMVAYHS